MADRYGSTRITANDPEADVCGGSLPMEGPTIRHLTHTTKTLCQITRGMIRHLRNESPTTGLLD